MVSVTAEAALPRHTQHHTSSVLRETYMVPVTSQGALLGFKLMLKRLQTSHYTRRRPSKYSAPPRIRIKHACLRRTPIPPPTVLPHAA